MPRTSRASRVSRTSPRVALRALVTTVTSVVLVAMTGVPAFAASAGTKPTVEENPHLIGSLEQLGTAAIVGVVVAIIVWVMMPKAEAEPGEDAHH